MLDFKTFVPDIPWEAPLPLYGHLFFLGLPLCVQMLIFIALLPDPCLFHFLSALCICRVMALFMQMAHGYIVCLFRYPITPERRQNTERMS